MTRVFNTSKCLACGLLVKYHYGPRNLKLDCDEAARLHGRAPRHPESLEALLMRSVQQQAD